MDLYQLRQIAAYLEQDRDIAPLLKAGPPSDGDPDPLLVAIWDGEQPTRFPHLINHQADGGYYLPVDFAEPIWLEAEDEAPAEDEDDAEDDEAFISFGSSVGLQRELARLAGMLQQAKRSIAKPSRALPAGDARRRRSKRSKRAADYRLVRLQIADCRLQIE